MTQEQQAKPEQWTDEQWQAITQRGNNLLVAAAAGSGKTSVLVERIIRRIMDESDPVGVDQLLVVTFINAAAAEMRHRIGDALRKALKDDPHSAHLRRQLALLQRATITTLHSFCLGILRQYYYLIDLDPDFRIADQLEGELLRSCPMLFIRWKHPSQPRSQAEISCGRIGNSGSKKTWPVSCASDWRMARSARWVVRPTMSIEQIATKVRWQLLVGMSCALKSKQQKRRCALLNSK